MGCNKCNDYNPCKQKTCGCPVLGLHGDCVTLQLGVFPCSGINGDDTLDNVLLGLEQFICDKVDSVASSIQMTNIGTGAGIYAGDTVLGVKQLRTLSSQDNTLTISQLTDNIDFSVTLNNIGGGAESFTGGNLRTFVSSDSSIAVSQTAQTIDLTANIPEQISLISIGTGNPVYTGQDINNDSQIASIIDVSTSNHSPIYVGYENGNHKFAGITSDSLSVVTDTNGNLKIETPPDFSNDGIPRFIVNNLYTGTPELGTLSKPFKDVSKAIDAFVGTGSAENPEYQNGIIIIQKGATYTFTGNLNYRNINLIIEEGAMVNSQPPAGQFLMDYDILDGNSDSFSNITIREGAELKIFQKGFRNRGTNNLTETGIKGITITGKGILRGEGPYDETYPVIESNFENLPDYNNSGYSQIAVMGIDIRTKQVFYRIGGSASIRFDDAYIMFTHTGADATFKFFNQVGGNIYFNTCEVVSWGNITDAHFRVEILDSTVNTPRLVIQDNIFQNTAQGVVFCKITNNSNVNPNMAPVIMGYQNRTRFGKYERIFECDYAAKTTIETVTFRYNIFETGILQNVVAVEASIDFTRGNTTSVQNQIGFNIVENLRVFVDRATATADVNMETGCKFFNTTTDAIDIVV